MSHELDKSLLSKKQDGFLGLGLGRGPEGFGFHLLVYQVMAVFEVLMASDQA